MRLGVAIDYGKYANASSLHLIAKKMFLELGKLMNKKKTFTVSALLYENIGIGDVNQHYDCISVPNMGGYKFPRKGILTANNVVIGLSGIDEIVLGQAVFKNKRDWERTEPLINKEISNWKKDVNKINFIHVPSNSDKKQMMEYLKIPEEKMHVIYHGVDSEKFFPPKNKKEVLKKISSAFYLDSNAPYIIHISESNWARKNVFRLLEAFKIAKEQGVRHKLIIVGRMDHIVHEKAQQIADVKILGFVSDEHLAMLLQGADALILPSLHEGFGLPLAEAMSCGVPVVTSNVFSPPEIVGSGGLFVNPYDVSDIADKIIEISKNDSLRDSLSRNSIEESRKFSWENAATTLLNLIEKNIKPNSKDFDFSESYDMAAYRTLVSVCQMKPDFYNIAVGDLLKFNYSGIINWALEVGLKDPAIGDYLLPFEKWLVSHG